MFLPLPTGDSLSRASWTYIVKVVIVGPGCNGCDVVRLFRRPLVDFARQPQSRSISAPGFLLGYFRVMRKDNGAHTEVRVATVSCGYET